MTFRMVIHEYIAQRKFDLLGAVTSLAFSMFILLSSYYGLKFLIDSLDKYQERSKIKIFLEANCTKPCQDLIIDKIKKSGQFKPPTFIEKATALKDVQTLLSQHKAWSQLSPEENPLPNVFTVQLKNSAQFLQKTDILENLKNIEGIESISTPVQTLKHLQFFRKILYSTLILFLFISLISIYLIQSGHIKTSIYNRLDEIEIFQLVGATKYRVLSPFLLEGLFLIGVSFFISTLGFFIIKYLLMLVLTDTAMGLSILASPFNLQDVSKLGLLLLSLLFIALITTYYQLYSVCTHRREQSL